MKYFIFLILSGLAFGQADFNASIDSAYSHAKKGIYWAFANIPETKKSDSHDLIHNDKLVCEVKLYKEVEGVKVNVTGYFDTYTVTVNVYKSYNTLRAEGYLKEKDKSFFDN